MGERKSIFVGRTMENTKRSRGLRPVSRAERKFMLPVSFCSLFVLRARSVGAYDSFMVNSELIATAPL